MEGVTERIMGMPGRLFLARTSFACYLLTFATVLFVSLIGSVLVSFFNLVNTALLYLLPVLISAVKWGKGPSFFAAISGMLCFDYLFVYTPFSFEHSGPRDYFNLSVFLLVALTMGTMATKLRDTLKKTSLREKRNSALYTVSEKIAAEDNLQIILNTFADNIGKTINGEIIVLVRDPDTDAFKEAAAFPSDRSLTSEEEWSAANWVLEHGESTEVEIENRKGARQAFLPIRTENKTIAVFAVKPDPDANALTSEQMQLLDAFANLASVALTRVRLAKEAERAHWLAESKKLHLAAIVESSADAIISVDLYGIIVSWNLGAEIIYGYSAEDVTGKPISTLVSPKNRADVPVVLEKVKRGERVKFYETVHIRKDGKKLHVSLTLSPIRDASGLVVGVSTIARDITESKMKEAQLQHSTEQLRALSARLQSIREEERTTLARDIHDELGQTLTGLKMNLVSLSQKPPRNRELLKERIKIMEEIADDTILVVRRISTALRPGVLDDLGIVAALEWQVNDFKKRTQIECTFSSTMEEADLGRDIATALFRIFQEALTNIIRHADATHVTIDINEDKGCVVLAVEDNGKGIPKNNISDPKSLGLLGMRERAIILGGEVHITSSKRKGTRVVVRIPHE